MVSLLFGVFAYWFGGLFCLFFSEPSGALPGVWLSPLTPCTMPWEPSTTPTRLRRDFTWFVAKCAHAPRPDPCLDPVRMQESAPHSGTA